MTGHAPATDPTPVWRRVLLVLALVAVAAAAWWPRIDAMSAERLDAGAKRALASFAAARALNAVISTVQETTLSLQPLGVGVSVAPGQVLDPVNDLVEQFSTLMLAAAVSFGVQRVLTTAGGHVAVTLALTAVLVIAAVIVLRDRSPPRWLRQGAVVLVVLRFALPLMVLGSDAGFRWLLADDYTAAQQGVERSAAEIAGATPPALQPRADEGTMDRMKRWAASVDIGRLTERVTTAVERTVDQVVRLIVVFLLQTLLLPLAILWALWQLARGMLAAAGAAAGAPQRPGR